MSPFNLGYNHWPGMRKKRYEFPYSFVYFRAIACIKGSSYTLFQFSFIHSTD